MQKGTNRLSIFAWCMYDFANSSFTTVVVTFIYSVYFVKQIVGNEIEGMALWSWGVAITGITVALLSPFMGALADRGGYRKLFLLVTTAVAITGSVILYTALPGQISKALFWFVVANIAFEMGSVFYNAFLPDIAPPEVIGRISGYGLSLGYAGGLLAMFMALVGFVKIDVPWFGFSTEAGQNIRAANLLVAAWFGVFSLPIFLWVKEDKSRIVKKVVRPLRGEKIFSSSIKQLVDTFHEIKRYRQIVKFLAARLMYNDGLITIFVFGSIYASGTFNFTVEEVLVFGIVLNIAAGIGTLAMGFLDDILGGKRTVQISLFFLILSSAMAVLAPNKIVFWTAGIIVAIFVGPNQAASRSLMVRFVPLDKETEFFGFFSFSGKATAFLGPFLLGLLLEIFGSQRAGMSVVVLFFIAGSLILASVDEEEGIRVSGRT